MLNDIGEMSIFLMWCWNFVLKNDEDVFWYEFVMIVIMIRLGVIYCR